MALTLRLIKGTALTYPELDGNFTYLSSSISAISSNIPTGFTLQAVLDTGNTAATNIRLVGSSLILDTLANSVIYYQDSYTGNSLTLTAPTLTAANVVTLPDVNGTLIANVNGYTPDSSGRVTIPTGSFTGSYTGSFTGSLLGSASYAFTASYALNAGTTVNTGSFVTTSSFNTFTSSYNTGSFTGSFVGNLAGTASYATRAASAATADFVTLIQGPGITVNGLQITASVRSVNGVLPTNGNIATTLTAVTTGTSASLQVSSSGAITSSLSNGLVWIITNNTPDPTKNGSAYIFVSGSVGQWYQLSNFDTATYDSRYLQLAGGTMAGNITIPTGFSLLGTSSWAQNATNATNSQTASYLPAGTYQITASWAVSASQAISSSRAISSSYALSSSYAASSSVAISSSYALSSSFAITASYALNANSTPLTYIATGSVTASVSTFSGSLFSVSGSDGPALNLSRGYTAYGYRLKVNNPGAGNTDTGIILDAGSDIGTIGSANVPAIGIGYQGYYTTINANGIMQIKPNADWEIRGNSTGDNIILSRATAPLPGPIFVARLGSAGTNLLTFTDTGNLLIGTTTGSGYRLDVSGSGNFTNGLTVTGSLKAPNITGSLQGTASFAITASYALNASSTLTSLIATGSVSASVNVGTGSIFNLVSGSTSMMSVSSSGLVTIPNPLSLSINAGNIINLKNGGAIFTDPNNILRINNGSYNVFNVEKGTANVGSITLGNLTFNSLLISSSGQFEYRSVLDSAGNPYFNITKGYAGANRDLLGANEIVLQVNNKYNGNPTNGGISRGIYIDLLSSGFSSYRAIENTVGNVTLNTTSGNTIIGSTLDSGFKLDVNGTTRSQGKLTVSTGGATIIGNTDITGSFSVDNSNGSLTLSSGSNSTLTLNSPSSSIVFYKKGSYAIELGCGGSKGIYAQDFTGGTAGDYITFTGKQGNFDTIQSGQGLVANQYTALDLIGRGYAGGANVASINLKNSFSTNPTRMIIYDNAITGSPISILPTDGNLLIGTTTDSGYRLNVSGSGNFTNALTVTGSLKAPNITGSLQGTASFATTSSYVKLIQGTNITINYTADGIAISSSAGGGSGGSGATDIDVANSTQIQLKSGSLFIGNALTVPFATTSTTASYVPGTIFTGTNPATSASYAITASYVLNSVINTAGLVTTSSFNAYTSSVTTTSSFNAYTSSVTTTSSFNAFTSSVVTTSSFNTWTGSTTSRFSGTSSYASQALSASYAVTSSYASQALSASYAVTSSYAINGGTSPIAIEVVIGGAPYVIQGGSATVTGLTNGSTTVTSTDFANRIVEVFRGGALQPGINLGDGSAYVTKTLASTSVTMSVALSTDEYIKIKCL